LLFAALVLLSTFPLAAQQQPQSNRAPWYKPPQLFVMTGFIANTTNGVWGPEYIVNGTWTPAKQEEALHAWEKDLGNSYDAEKTIQDFQEAGATGVIFYDKWHDGLVNHATHLTDFKTHRDFVKETLAALRKHNMASVVYYSVGLDNNPEAKFRDWTCLDVKGKPMGLAFSTEWKSFYSPYRQYVIEQIAEVLKDDGPVDGLWLDLYVQPTPISYDQFTLRQFKERYHNPVSQASPAQLSQFQLATLRDFLLEIRQKEQAIQPQVSFTFNGAGMADVVEPAKARQVDSVVDWFSVEGHVWPNIDRSSQIMHAADRPSEEGVLINSSWYVPLSDDAPPPVESQSEAVALAAATWIHGGNVYAAITPGHSGVYDTEGDLALLRAMGRWLKDNRPWLLDARPYADIGVLTGHPADDVEKIPDLGELWRASHGFTPARADVDPGYDTSLSLRKMGYLTERVGGTFTSRKFDLGSYRMLLLPETALLDDRDLEDIREYVRKGGALLSFGHGSLFDQEGRPRSNFALADVFGCEYAGTLPGYKRLALSPGSGLASTLTLNPGALAVKPTTGKVLAQWKYAGDSPAIVENTYGQGRAIYVSVEETAFGEGSALLNELTARLIGAPTFEVHGTRHYALLVNRKGDDLLCYLLNRDTAPAGYTQGRLIKLSETPQLETPEPVRLTLHTAQLGNFASAELIPSGQAVWMSQHKGSIELDFQAVPSVTTVRLTRP
jgi:hypothetical protein